MADASYAFSPSYHVLHVRNFGESHTIYKTTLLIMKIVNASLILLCIAGASGRQRRRGNLRALQDPAVVDIEPETTEEVTTGGSVRSGSVDGARG